MNHGDIHSTVLSCLHKVIPKEKNITNDTDLLQIGIDSMSFIRVIVLIEEALNIQIEDEDIRIEYFNSINNITELLSKYVA
ncbi:acyl carrier protein [Fictibacillus enclensis]|uniref:acyl carrier protein n=1 Tax=Fictibacillus enclensis TaxID=1017270 RepID=UPI0025A20325|nr:acyl carrier protein [Fictibacillus enclensis]MDM5335687.1 acyl carrier protein [Fictibacillus enclensis]